MEKDKFFHLTMFECSCLSGCAHANTRVIGLATECDDTWSELATGWTKDSNSTIPHQWTENKLTYSHNCIIVI